MNSADSKTPKKQKRSKEKEIITQFSDTVQDAYKASFLHDSRSDSAHTKKHNSADAKTLKKKKRCKENEFITQFTGTVQDADEVSFLDDFRSECAQKKKHKCNESSVGKDLNQFVSNCKKLSYIEKKVCDDARLNINSADSKTPKKKKRSKENEIITQFSDTVQDADEVSFLDESRSDSAHKKKHKNKCNESSLGKDLDQFVSSCKKLSNVEKQVCDDVMINMNSADSKTLKKKKRKKENEFIAHFADTVQDAYEVSLLYDSRSDSAHKKKHKCNESSMGKDLDHSADSKTLKKKKRCKENEFITHFADTVQDAYEVSFLDNSRSDSARKKKRKKCKSNESSIDKDLDQLLSNCEKEVSNYAAMKKDKSVKDNSKDSTSVNQTVSNISGQAYSYNFFSTKMNKSANVIQDGYDDINGNRNSCIITRDKISSNNERHESDPTVRTDDSSNVEKSKESCTDAFEITENIFKENENLKENKSVDLDFIEEDVDFEIPLLHANESVKNLSEDEKNEMISQGVPIKTGKFTQEEDAIILKNIENFLKTYDTLDISEVLGIGRLIKDSYFTKFLRAKHFYAKLGKGLNDRTLISIYKRARRLIHPYQNKEKFQETEIRSVKFLRNVVNKKWISIGDTLGRTEDSCLQAYRWHAKKISHGKWTEEEEQQLIAAIKTITGSSDLSCEKLKGISWDEVATHVPTRNFSQCRMHWAFHLAWKPGALKGKWDKNCSKKLIDILRNEWYVENASEIDWLKVYESFVNVAPSHIFLQKRWLTLRYQIKGFKTLSYRDTINILCKKYNNYS